jgi:Flp pilus assembly protein TadB
MGDEAEQVEEKQVAAPDEGAVDPSLYDDIAGLIEDGKTYAEAELAFQKARMSYAAQRGKSIATFGGLAIFLVLLALMALVLGLVLGLTPYLGAFGAMGAVVLGLLLVAGLCGMMVQSHLARLKEAFAKDETEEE